MNQQGKLEELLDQMDKFKKLKNKLLKQRMKMNLLNCNKRLKRKKLIQNNKLCNREDKVHYKKKKKNNYN